MTRHRHITHDNMDIPNGPLPPGREYGSTAIWRDQPSGDGVKMAVIFGTVALLLLMALGAGIWWYAGTLADHRLIAWRYVGTALRLLIIGLTILAVVSITWQGIRLLRGLVDLSISTRQPGGWHIRGPVTLDSVKDVLADHYATDRAWAEGARFRGMNGTYAPTFTDSRHNPDVEQVLAPLLLLRDVSPHSASGSQEGPGATIGGEAGVIAGQGGSEPQRLSYEPESRTGILTYGRAVADGAPVQMPIGRSYHTIRQGETGQGKTTALNTELVQLHRYAAARRYKSGGWPIHLLAGDFKGELGSTWGKSGLLVDRVANDPEDIADLLTYALEEISKRQALFARISEEVDEPVVNYDEYRKLRPETLPILMVYLDEANQILGSPDKDTAREASLALRAGLQLGRSAGVFYSVGSQYLLAKLFGRDGSQQFVTRQYFGAYDQAAIRMVFGGKVGKSDLDELKALMDGRPGRALMAAPGLRPTVLDGLAVSREEIKSAIQGVE